MAVFWVYLQIFDISQRMPAEQRTNNHSEHTAMMVELKTVLSVVGLMCLNILFSVLISVN